MKSDNGLHKLTYCQISKSNFEDVVDYDQTIGIINRETYLKYLWEKNNVIINCKLINN